MREIITISLPKTTRKTLALRIKTRGFHGMSEYMRYLIQQDTDLISQDEIIAMTQQADHDYKKGTLKKRSSLRELL